MEKIKKHIRNRIRFTAAVIILMAAAVLMTGNVYAASGGWETEENNDISQADQITVNQTYSGSIEKAGDEDYYKFTTSEDGMIELTFNHSYIDNSKDYWKVSLLDGDAETIIWEYSDGDKESMTMAKVGLPAGTYYVCVEDDYWDETPYAFTVSHTPSSVWETEDNDNRTIADEINVNEAYYGTIMNGGDKDYYKFTTFEDGTIELTFNHDYIDNSKDYWKVSLLDSDAETIIWAYSDGDKESMTMAKVGLPAGTYYVFVKEDYWDETPYAFTVSHTPSSTWETEYNDNRTIADPVSLGTRYYGNSMDSSDKDCYTFDLPRNTKLNVNFEHPYIDEDDYWKVAILDKDETAVSTVYISGTKESTSWRLGYLAAGKYYVYVTPYDHSTQTYSFQIDENKIPYGTTIKSIKGGKNSITLTWKKSSDAQGYEIYRSMKKNGTYKKVKTITNKNTVKFTNKKLKKGKRYYYKIRSYKVADGTKYYSDFSSVKSVKAK